MHRVWLQTVLSVAMLVVGVAGAGVCGPYADFVNETADATASEPFRCECARGTRQCFYDVPGSVGVGAAANTSAGLQADIFTETMAPFQSQA
eukprot:3344826-Rhodomonas_salina.1